MGATMTFGRNGTMTNGNGERAGMSPLVKVLLWMFGIGFLLVTVILVIGALMFVSAKNTANSYENNISTVHKNNQNILSNFGLKIATMAKVTEQYKEDFIELVKAEMAGRYGDPATRPNVLANWVQERGMSFDSKMYREINAEVASGYNAFANAQTKLLDVKNAYQTALGSFPTGNLMEFWGYPKITLSDYDIVTSQDTQDTFRTGVQKPLDPFGN